MSNPIANQGQFAAEAEVRQMREQPQTQAAVERSAQLWRAAFGTDIPQGLGGFEEAMDAWVTNYLFKAAARDPAEPRFVRNFMPAYSWNGSDVPDARMGGDNPDNTYRLAGIAHGQKYRVKGQILGKVPGNISFTLVENWGTSVTVQTIEIPGIDIGDDGSFEITIDDTPADGRPNHLTTNPRVKFLFVRDSRMDWERETPLDLQIERVGGASIAPISADERLDEALRRVAEEVPLYYWFHRLSSGLPVNEVIPPSGRAGFGGLVTQATAMGRFKLRDDQAVVLRYDPTDAGYCSYQMASWWYQSIDAHRRQTGLSAAQSERDADGEFITLVVSARDPGVPNWIDTAGHENLLPMIRWQAMSGNPQSRPPSLTSNVVPFAELEGLLPDIFGKVSQETRRQQIEARRVAWNRQVTP